MSNLFSDKFFKDYKEEFINHFVEQSKERNDCILSEGTIRTLATNIYDALFFSASIEKFKKLVRNALDSHVDFIVCLTKSSMLLIKDYIDYILKNSLSFENLKELVEYTEKFLVEAEEVYSVHIEKLRKEVNNLKRECLKNHPDKEQNSHVKEDKLS
ncbi:hypothetical protein [Desulfurobacterium thermolithotrophum]|uniref:hypothetical protein n=1 Tax=Desulfurobacterium thermolithotrophum TaxID=64160 RepID=UPI0005A0F41F|nr:hypothetical protein [Desulfurobacterium thermolithotrophum]